MIWAIEDERPEEFVLSDARDCRGKVFAPRVSRLFLLSKPPHLHRMRDKLLPIIFLLHTCFGEGCYIAG